jgi:hypothetical protein
MPCPRLPLAAAAVGLALAACAAADVPAPPPPAQYDAELRYRIRANRAQRLGDFDRLIRGLKAAGFVPDPVDPADEADPTHDRITGRVPPDRVNDVLNVPFVQTLMLLPPGAALPADPAARVPVNLWLTKLPPGRQNLLWSQARERLRAIGFRDYVGYDDRGFTRLRGTMPAGELDTLLGDLRNEPGGWLLPEVPASATPEPLRSVLPVRIIEVTPDPEGAPPAPAPAAVLPGQEALSKITPDLAAVLQGEGAAAKRLRVEFILTESPSDTDPVWARSLKRSMPDIIVEGRAGTVVTATLPGGEVPALASVPGVTTVRLPVDADTLAAVAGPPAAGFDPLRESGLTLLHERGPRGGGVRVVVIDHDFAGYDSSLGGVSVRPVPLTDLTVFRDPASRPEPVEGKGPGRGVLTARAVLRAAPYAQVSLVRVGRSALYQVLTVARHAVGKAVVPEEVIARLEELERERTDLLARREFLLGQRRELLEAFDPEEEGAARRKENAAKLAELAKQEADFLARFGRVIAAREGLAALAGSNIVVCPLVWNTGYPLDGTSALSRFLEENLTPPLPAVRIGGLREEPKLLWFQAAGDTARQAWVGPLLEGEEGVIQFAAADCPLSPGRWSNRLNFLGFEPAGGAVVPDLPADARLRVTVQWTETHDPAVTVLADDPYRLPLADLRPVLLWQRDPSGKKLPADDLAVVGRAVALPQRLSVFPNRASYQQSVEVPVAGGRFAVRIEGRVPQGLVPPGVETVPADQRRSEVRLRVFVEVVDAATRVKGRPVFVDFAPIDGGVGVPGDAFASITVGAAETATKVERFSAAGAGPGLELRLKPQVVAFNRLTPGGGRTAGTGVAAGFAAGTAASMLSGGAQPNFLLSAMRQQIPGLFVVPEVFARRK